MKIEESQKEITKAVGHIEKAIEIINAEWIDTKVIKQTRTDDILFYTIQLLRCVIGILKELKKGCKEALK